MTDEAGPHGVDRAEYALREGEWLDRNRAHWDERVPIHVASDFYDLDSLRTGGRRLTPLDETELQKLFPGADGRFDLSGKRVLHLQCHFGADSIVLAQRGGEVIGIDFSLPAVKQARALAEEAGLSDRLRFIAANVYDARHALPEPDSFDLVFVTWGTVIWLPDAAEWARIIEWFLAPGGRLYFAEGHPSALVFDGGDGGMPVFTYPYGSRQPDVIDDPSDYADPDARLENTISYEWMHPTSELFTVLTDAGLSIERMGEHFEVPWRMFPVLTENENGMYGWPEGRPWFPLALTMVAAKPEREQR